MAAGGGRKPTQAPLSRPGGAGGRPSHPRPHLFAAGIAKFSSGLGWAAGPSGQRVPGAALGTAGPASGSTVTPLRGLVAPTGEPGTLKFLERDRDTRSGDGCGRVVPKVPSLGTWLGAGTVF